MKASRAISIFRVLSCQTNLNPKITYSSSRVTSVEPLIIQSREKLLVNLHEETEAAELLQSWLLQTRLPSWLAGILCSWTLKPWNWTATWSASATYYESSVLPHLNSRGRPGQQPVCPLPRHCTADVLGRFLAVLQLMEQARRADLQMAEEPAERQEAHHQAAFA